MFSRKKSPSKKNVAFNPNLNLNIHTSANGTAVHPYFSEKGLGVKNTSFINKRDSVKYLVTQLEQQSVGTASETYKAGLYVGIGKNKNTRGIVKKQLIEGDVGNASTENLDMKTGWSASGDMVLKENPRMLARQVASWKVARTLNMRVLSTEKYAIDSTNTNANKSSLLGISALLPETSMSLHSLLEAERQRMDTAGLTAQQRQVHLGNAIFSGAIQKQLSDLQLIDALTGQTDRHNGNIFIDIVNQKVHGIDNDQSFFVNPKFYNMYNAIRSFKLRTNKQADGRTVYDANYGLEYTQSQIDVYSAQKILKLTDTDLTNILTDKEGAKYDEFINSTEIEAAKLRLAAIKRRILALQKDGKLIKTWDGNSYNDALDPQLYGALGKMDDNWHTSVSNKYQSYVARAVNNFAHDKNQFGG